MIATLISAIIACLLIFLPPLNTVPFDHATLSWIVLLFSALIFFLVAAIHLFAFAPLQKAEQNLTPRLMDIYLQDGTIRFTTIWLLAFPLLGIFILLELNYFQYVRPIFIFALWLFSLGISIDTLHQLIRRTLHYLTPFSVLKYFTDQAIHAIGKSNNFEMLDEIDGLTEIGLKSIERSLPSLCVEGVNGLQLITKNYLQKAEQTLNKTSQDQEKINYSLFYLFQRLEVLYEKALKNHLEPICSKIITSLGKITIDVAKFDLTLTIHPLHYIGKFAEEALEKHLDVVADKASCTLVEIGKSLINDVDVQYQNLKDPFFSIIEQLEDIAKSVFRKDKTINVALLILPFQDLKELFKSEKVAAHQDTPAIVADIDRVIGQFEQLELVMRTIPPIKIAEEEEKTEPPPKQQ